MAFTTRTDLGRTVLIGDWVGFHRDRLLKVLHAMLKLSGVAVGLTIEQISSVTGLGPDHTSELVRTVAGRSLIRTDEKAVWLLTEAGIRWVDESPATADRE